MKDDYIVSLTKKNEYIKITNVVKREQQYSYKALILENHFSQEIMDVINEFWECVDTFSMSVLDDLEEKIIGYNFILKESKIKIFDIKFKGDYIIFYSKYPTHKGFIDDYPDYPT